MKPLSTLVTHVSGLIETVSTFSKLYVEDETHSIVAVYKDVKVDDGVWDKEYAMSIYGSFLVPVFHTVEGVRQPLLREEVPVSVPEFTLMRFLIWDHNLIPLKQLMEDSLTRCKARDLAIQNNQMPAAYEFDLPEAIPASYFLDYLDEIA